MNHRKPPSNLPTFNEVTSNQLQQLQELARVKFNSHYNSLDLDFSPLGITTNLNETEILRLILQVDVAERANQIMYALGNNNIVPVVANNLLSLIRVLERLSNLQRADSLKANMITITNNLS